MCVGLTDVTLTGVGLHGWATDEEAEAGWAGKDAAVAAIAADAGLFPDDDDWFPGAAMACAAAGGTSSSTAVEWHDGPAGGPAGGCADGWEEECRHPPLSAGLGLDSGKWSAAVPPAGRHCAEEDATAADEEIAGAWYTSSYRGPRCVFCLMRKFFLFHILILLSRVQAVRGKLAPTHMGHCPVRRGRRRTRVGKSVERRRREQ